MIRAVICDVDLSVQYALDFFFLCLQSVVRINKKNYREAYVNSPVSLTQTTPSMLSFISIYH